METKWELYDLGRTTHKPIKGLYEFIINNAQRFDPEHAEKLVEHAVNRKTPGYSMPQEYFTRMCEIWVKAHYDGEFPIDIEENIYPDTIPRFQQIKAAGRKIGILTSGTRDFTEIFYSMPVPGTDQKLSDLVDDYFLGEEIGDKAEPETYERIWEKTQGGIWAIVDDKPKVCRAALEGLDAIGGNADHIFWMDRNNKYDEKTIQEMASLGIIRISSFDEIPKYEMD